uniref:ATP synthase subunit a n=1 Tax=Dahlica ochrostigma TaxID=2093356 RepID=A0A6H1XK48_9NEOP|nr:ATP synthase F0 subunit 6 [Dahlica ochrostigma]QJA15902.1 ATP synthase F0 subunit 6 [Dahlica ochrostigma]
MTNLFSIFDPYTNMFNMSFNWLNILLGFLFMPSIFWLINNKYIFFWKFTSNKLHSEFKNLMKNDKMKGSTFIFISLFYFILFNNFLGLLPYIFTSTSHLVMTLSMTLPLWLSFMLYGWLNNTQHMFAHLLPQGTPQMLMSFMIMIETISNFIRPMTLSIRLSANMIAGHLLLTLLGNTGFYFSNYLLFILILTQITLLILEFSVSIIQSYVIAILSVLYSSETN